MGPLPAVEPAMMRRLPLLLATAVLSAATTVAAAAPQSGQPILNAPPAGSDLPDMGSPAAALLSQSDEYRLGAMVAQQLRDQNAILEDPRSAST